MFCERALACPHCQAALALSDGVLRCQEGHAFDVARQGYVNLLVPGTHTGTADTPEMIAARMAWFATGHFRPLVDRVAGVVAALAEHAEGCIVDMGAGTGEYLAAALVRLPGREGLALDVSKHACRRAAQVGERVGAVVCDAWGKLPLADGSAAIIMSIFAPRNPSEFARVLAGGGALVIVTPNAGHLASLVEFLQLVTVEPKKDQRLETQLAPYFSPTGAEQFEYELLLSRGEAAWLAGMGPSARHVSGDELNARLAAMEEPIATRVSVTIGTWRHKEGNR